jgi:uncharacterized protein (TIRG00374 family)
MRCRSLWNNCVGCVEAHKIAPPRDAQMMPPPHEPEGAPENLPGEQNTWRKAPVVFGLLLLVAFIAVLMHRDEGRRCLVLLTHLTPAWLLVAAGCQVGTYVCAAAVWSRVLHRSDVALRLWSLVPLGLAKLFVDQIVPTAGVGGSLLVVHGLIRRGAPPGPATAALLMDLLSFYAAHALAVVLALGILWGYHDVHRVVLLLAVLFAGLAAGVALTIFRLHRRGRRVVPPWLQRLPGVRRVLQALAAVPAEVLHDPGLLLQTTAMQFTLVALDAVTFDVMLRAVGHPLHPAAVFASFTMVSVVAILGVIPGGLGLFEGGAVAMLRWFDVPIEAGLAATLLLRVWTFWLPMAPGLWMMRHEARAPGP